MGSRISVFRRKQRKLDVAAVAVHAQINAKMEDLKWRSSSEYRRRQILAWMFNIFTVLILCFVSLIYALKFGQATMKNLVIAWLVAYGWTFAIVEPIQVFIFAILPCLMSEDTR